MSFFRPRASSKPGPSDWEKCRDWLGEVTQFSSRSVERVSSERELYSYLKVSEVREGVVQSGDAGRDGALQVGWAPHQREGPGGNHLQD